MNMPSLSSALTIIIVFLSLINAAHGQTRERAAVGAVLQGSLDLHSASFSRLPEIDNCCPGFTGGSGMGWLVGLSYLTPLNSEWSVDVRAGYQHGSVDMSTSESKLISQNNGAFETASIRHDLSLSVSRMTIEPMAIYALTPSIGLRMGLFGAYQLNGRYLQGEFLENPSNAVFDNGTKSRNQAEGNLESLASMNLGVTVGIGTDLPLNADRSLTVSPELLLTLSPTNILQNTSWSMTMIRAGVVVSFSPEDDKEEISDSELFEVARNVLTNPRSAYEPLAVPSVAYTGLLESGTPVDKKSIRVEEFASNRVRPLLPYVFFDPNSNVLSPRYRQISAEQVESYSLENFYNLDAMVTYYQLLNVVGKRLQEQPDASITIVGCTDKQEAASSEDLGKRRALVVRNYLVDTWKIPASRIAVDQRGLPSQASNEADPDGAAENRRVEISSSDPSILSAVASNDTMRVFDPPAVRFNLGVSDGLRLKSWTLFVSEGDHIIKTFHGAGAPPANVDWRIAEQARFIPRGTRNVDFMLVVQDSNGTVIPTETGSIPVSEVTIADKRSGGGTDKSVDRFSLILFGFDKSDVTPDQQAIINSIKKRITSTSTLSITGYTDRSGTDEYNKRLSEQRARSVSAALSAPRSTVTGQGETLPLYDNETPEGRFYSRTVEVIVETPMK